MMNTLEAGLWGRQSFQPRSAEQAALVGLVLEVLSWLPVALVGNGSALADRLVLLLVVEGAVL